MDKELTEQGETCPFCGTGGFDLVGLKIHLTGEGLIYGEGCSEFINLEISEAINAVQK